MYRFFVSTVCCSLLLLLQDGRAETRIARMITSDTQLKIGDTFKATCTIHRTDIESIYMAWFKSTLDQDLQVEKKQQICVNKFTNEGFTDFYTCSVNVLDDTGYSIDFHIEGKDIVSSGDFEIGCNIGTEKQLTSKKQLTVIAPIKDITLISRSDDGMDQCVYLNNSSIDCHEGQTLGISCSVTGSYPAPKVAIFLDEKDITDTFEKTQERVVEQHDRHGEYIVQYNVNLNAFSLEVDYTVRNKRLECRASVPGTDFEDKAVGAIIHMDYFKPKFRCEPHTKKQSQISIKCHLISNPYPEEVFVSWQSIGGTEVSVFPGQILGNKYLVKEANTTDGDVFKLTINLNINQPKREDYIQYKFNAANAQGLESHVVDIYEMSEIMSLASSIHPSNTVWSVLLILSVIINR